MSRTGTLLLIVFALTLSWILAVDTVMSEEPQGKRYSCSIDDKLNITRYTNYPYLGGCAADIKELEGVEDDKTDQERQL